MVFCRQAARTHDGDVAQRATPPAPATGFTQRQAEFVKSRGDRAGSQSSHEDIVAVSRGRRSIKLKRRNGGLESVEVVRNIAA
jgi:hypothetical protein